MAGLPWTKEEEQIIRTHFWMKDADAISQLLPNRTASAVRHRAKELGLKKSPQKRGQIRRLKWEHELETRLGEPICKWLQRRYMEEEAIYRELTTEAGINTRTLMRLIRKCGIEPISHSEAAKRYLKYEPKAIKRLVAASHTEKALRKSAQTRQANWQTNQTEQERDFLFTLADCGLIAFPEFAVGKYNIDFAFPSVRLAVELDPGWHKWGERLKDDLKKDAFLESKGWTILHLDTRCRILFNVNKVKSLLKSFAHRHP